MSGKIQEKLKQLQPGGYCAHRSWGIGKIVAWEEGRLVIDFVNKAGHTMEFEFAAQSLRPLDADHIEVRIMEDMAAVRKMAIDDPAALLQSVIQSLRQDATPERIESLLVSSVIPMEGWRKWWEGARRILKKDKRYELPGRKNMPILFHETARDPRALAIEELKTSTGAKAQILALIKLEKLWKANDDEVTAGEIIDLVNKCLLAMPKTQTDLAIELVLARDQFAIKAGLGEIEPPLTQWLPLLPHQLASTLATLPAARQMSCLDRARAMIGENWSVVFGALLSTATGSMMQI